MVLGIGDPGEKFGRDDEQVLGGAGADEGPAHLKGVEPARAGGIQVEGKDPRGCRGPGRGRSPSTGTGWSGIRVAMMIPSIWLTSIPAWSRACRAAAAAREVALSSSVAWRRSLNAGQPDDFRLGPVRKRLQDLAVGADIAGHCIADAGDADGSHAGLERWMLCRSKANLPSLRALA